MTSASPIQDQVERKAHSLRLSGFTQPQLLHAISTVLSQGLPLRDAIVLRAAKRLADMATDRSTDAWRAALPELARSVSGPTFALWLKPLEVLGEDGSTLILTAPEGIRAWAERRYSSLIGEVLQAVSDFKAVRIVAACEGEMAA